MSKYLFTSYDGQLFSDPEEYDLPDIDAARHTATRFAGQLLQDNPTAFWEGEDWYLEVTDAQGLVLFRLVLSAYDAPAAMRGQHSGTTNGAGPN